MSLVWCRARRACCDDLVDLRFQGPILLVAQRSATGDILRRIHDGELYRVALLCQGEEMRWSCLRTSMAPVSRGLLKHVIHVYSAKVTIAETR